MPSDAKLIEPHIGHKISWIGTRPENTEGKVVSVTQQGDLAYVRMSWCNRDIWSYEDTAWLVWSDDWVCLTCAESDKPVNSTESTPTFEQYLAQELSRREGYSAGGAKNIARNVVEIMEELIKKED